jgi:hypothetical protein
MRPDPAFLEELLEKCLTRYLPVRPGGLEIDGRLVPAVKARILSFGGARTLYRGRKPLCRSLDAVRSLKHTDCGDCPERKHCTPQVRLDLRIDGQPFRLLLAFSAARNFLFYARDLQKQGLQPEAVDTLLTVLDRHSWGELRFAKA